MHNNIDSIIKKVSEYTAEKELAPLKEAYIFASEAHADKLRLSGQPYMEHVLAVAGVLADMRLDIPTITAGLLHGTLKDEAPKITPELLGKRFGQEVAGLVVGATRIKAVQFNTRLAYQAENIRKMLLAMAKDIRVILIQLADRFHDMQSISVLSPTRQDELARETMELYAPLAGRLGIDWIKRELEDLSFAALQPEAHRRIAEKIQSSLPEREAYVEKVKELLSYHLRKEGLNQFRVMGRPKHLLSIHKKLLVQNITIDKIYDKVAFRIIVDSVKECYAALGIIHSLWPPIDGRFKDFISHPKSNGYRSVHTSVIGPDGDFMEIQIRTEEMDMVASEGIAAHWAYKEGQAACNKEVKLFKWLKQLVAMMQELEDPGELLDTVKGELYEDEIYVLTPNGEVKGFPKGSTPVDFAYAIHTEVGNRCNGAKINGQISPLRSPLRNGDVVEIITSPHQKPNRNWLHIVKTSRARNRIRQWLNHEEKEQQLEKGRDLCERELRRNNLSLKKLVKTGQLQEILKKSSSNSIETLLLKIGSGKLSIKWLKQVVQPEPTDSGEHEEKLPELGRQQKTHRRHDKDEVVKVEGAVGIPVKLANCCRPVPGDPIIGFITTGRGITVHKNNCPNLLSAEEERRIAVSWSGKSQTTYRASVQALGYNRKGLLAALSSTISNDDANIASFEASTTKEGAKFNMVLEVNDSEHLSRIIQHIRQIEGINDVYRN